MTRFTALIILLLPFAGENAFPLKIPDPPLPPVLKRVTVDNPAASVILSWEPSPSSGVAGYVAYRYRNNEGYAIDTIWNPSATTFTDYEGGALFFSEAYVVAAIDSEDNISPLSNSIATVFLTSELDTCNNRIVFRWNQYNPHGTTLNRYEIFASASGSDFIVAATVHPDSLRFTWKEYETGVQYRFYVRAVTDTGLNSESNLTTLGTDIEKPPAWIETTGIYPVEGNRLRLNVHYDPASELNLFRIKRKELPDGEYSIAGTVNSTGGAFAFTDPASDASERYLYIVEALNRCGNPAITSGPASGIVVSGTSVDGLTSLNWNPFTGWNDEVTGYIIQYDKGSGSFETLASVAGSETSFSIDFRNIMYLTEGVEVCFRIAAEGPQSNKPEFTVLSNLYCIPSPVKVFVPTAFTPDGNGLNDSFGPVIPFTPAGYSFRIMDRNGRLLFSSTSPEELWDGTFRGEKQPPGPYLWYLTLTTPTGKRVDMKGTVALIYNN